MWTAIQSLLAAVGGSKTATLGGIGTAAVTWVCQYIGLEAEETALVLTAWSGLCVVVGAAVKILERHRASQSGSAGDRR